LRQKDPGRDAEEIRRSLVDRDRADVGRAVDPLRPAPDALPVDTTGLGPDEVLARVLALVRSRIPPSTAA
jgi:cytidylate kinase